MNSNISQLLTICVSLIIQAVLVYLRYRYEPSENGINQMVIETIIVIGLFYLVAWMILKIDFISKIIMHKITLGLFFIMVIVIGVVNLNWSLDTYGNYEIGIVNFVWFGIALMTFVIIAKEELKKSNISNPIGESTPAPTKKKEKKQSTPAPESNDFYVECLNCAKIHTNPIDPLCSNCGKNMHVKDVNIVCNSCGGEYENTEVSCPYCGNSN